MLAGGIGVIWTLHRPHVCAVAHRQLSRLVHGQLMQHLRGRIVGWVQTRESDEQEGALEVLQMDDQSTAESLHLYRPISYLPHLLVAAHIDQHDPHVHVQQLHAGVGVGAIDRMQVADHLQRSVR